MLVINRKYKPIINTAKPKPTSQTDYNSSIVQNMEGKGIEELIQKVKDIKVKEINKKRNANTNNKISFD